MNRVHSGLTASIPSEQTAQAAHRLQGLLERAVWAFNNLPTAERRKMIAQQRASFIRGMTTPCEHGVLDFEQCGDCRSFAPEDGR